MNPKRFFTRGAALLLVLVVVLLSIRGVVAQAGPGPTQEDTFPQLPRMGSASYSLNWDVLANGGGVMASTSYHLQSTLGQNAIGTSTSASYSLHSGFWQLLYNSLYLPIILR
ncbi:MAG: hypothetical protein ACOYYS_20245 [Chloroflexota bacterium]